MRQLIFATALVALTINASAESLRSFEDGTLASAEDVNHNFEFLEGRIDDLISKIEAPMVTKIADCDSNPDSLQQLIVEARGLNSVLTVSASGSCNRIDVTNQTVSIVNNGNLTINNTGGGSDTAATVTVRESASLTISGYPTIYGGENTAISIWGASTFISGYIQISGGNIGISAISSSFALLGNAGFSNLKSAMVLNSSTGLLLGKLPSGGVFPCEGGSSVLPACLIIGDSNTAFDLTNSRLGLAGEFTTVYINAKEARVDSLSSLGLRDGTLIFVDEFKLKGGSNITATGNASDHLQLFSNVQLTQNSVLDLDYDNTSSESGVGKFQINGDIEVQLGGVLAANGSSENDSSKVSFTGNLTVLAGKAVLTDTQMQLGTSEAPKEINVIGGQLIMDGFTFDKLPSPNGNARDIQVLQGGSLTLIHDNPADPTPTCDEINSRVLKDLGGKTYYLPFKNVSASPHDYGEFCAL